MSRRTRGVSGAGVVLLALLSGACGEGPTAPVGLDCNVPLHLIVERPFDGDEIPALTNPDLSVFGRPEIIYLRGRDRVIGLIVNGQPVAVPHNILWWHEIINFEFTDRRVVVSYSPLTGSSLAFDLDGARVGKFVVSDFLFNSNTMMEDRETGSLWAQMGRGAQCGDRTGSELGVVPTWEMPWSAWRNLFPNTLVVSSDTGFDFFYTIYPYDDYEDLDNPETLFPVERVDPRRRPKERVLGIPVGRGGVALPFTELEAAAGLDSALAVNLETPGGPAVVFWSTLARAAVAFRPVVDGQTLTFEAEERRIRDVETGSLWNLAGRVLEGPLEGAELELLPDAYVAFWFAWAIFQPDTELWSG